MGNTYDSGGISMELCCVSIDLNSVVPDLPEPIMKKALVLSFLVNWGMFLLNGLIARNLFKKITNGFTIILFFI